MLVPILAVGLNLPWPLASDVNVALPYLVLPVVHRTTFRAPRLLPASYLFAIGLLADLVAETPLGFWTLMLLVTRAVGQAMPIVLHCARTSVPGALVSVPVYALLALSLALTIPYAFALSWPEPAPRIAGIGLGAVFEVAVVLASPLWSAIGSAGRRARLLVPR
ncbi:MAG: hypothetical protein R3D57_06490 [Hyphomicrobiaceae bacterium]